VGHVAAVTSKKSSQLLSDRAFVSGSKRSAVLNDDSSLHRLFGFGGGRHEQGVRSPSDFQMVPGHACLSQSACPVRIGPGVPRRPRMVKIFKCAERSRSSMMDVEDEHNHMRAAFGLRYRFGKPGTPAAE